MFKNTSSSIDLSDITEEEYLTLSILYGGFEGKIVRSTGGPKFVELALFRFNVPNRIEPTLHIRVNALTPLSTLEGFAPEKYQVLISLIDTTFDDDFVKFVYDRIKFFDVTGSRPFDEYGVELPKFRRRRSSYLVKRFFVKNFKKVKTFVGDIVQYGSSKIRDSRG